MSVVIKIENVSKQYRLGLIGTNTLKGDIQRWWCRIKGLPDPTLTVGQENSVLEMKGNSEVLWALRDIDLAVEQGDVLGIIGKNGAGKSTLLKLLSRVTAPTYGKIKIKGRIASLLEVGTGFHPELTGRENIFLNGAILGMTKNEIRSKLDEIVDFAGVPRYLDTPVKRYSSGMYVRLAFAVAAHLDPEILIVDEVLAVGDAEFQKKAIGKMEDVSSCLGKTILFVSHDMSNIKKLCKNSILLDNGKVVKGGNTEKIINIYQNSNKSSPIISGVKSIHLIDLRIYNELGKEIDTFNTFDKLKFILKYEIDSALKNVSFAICFNNSNNTRITSLWSSFQNVYFNLNPGEFHLEILVESIGLSPDVYETIIYAESQGIVIERIDNYKRIVVGYTNTFGLVRIPTYQQGQYIEKCTFKML